MADAARARAAQITSHLAARRGLLQDQVAIVTGAGQGIGAEIARLFAVEGARVVVSDVDGDKATETVAAITQAGGDAVAVPGDLLREGYIDELVTRAAEWSGGKIHVLVNNAGFTWDGVIHKVCFVFPFLSFVVVCMTRTNE